MRDFPLPRSQIASLHMAPLFSTVLYVILIAVSLPSSSASSPSQNTLRKGSSLSVENPNHALVSPDGTFTAGFFQVGDNAYSFAIWFSDDLSCPTNCTLVWMANRDEPVNGKRSKLSLLRTGILVLTDAGHSIVWSTNTWNSGSLSLKLFDTGNLVLVTELGVFLWQSFNSPTDTLLPQQVLSRGTMLVSSRSKTNFSSGFYKLSFDDDNVLHLIYDGPDTSSVFWPDHWLLSRDAGRTSYNSSRAVVLDYLGNFTSSDNFTSLSADYGVRIQRRVTLDFDGNLRMYSRENGRGSNYWVITFQAFAHSCRIHGTCGSNSVCSYLPSLGKKTCSCLPGFTRISETDWSLGCKPTFNLSCGGKNDDVSYLKFPHVESYGYDIGYLGNTTFDECLKICTERCDCKGFEFKFILQNHPDNIPYCIPKSQLLNGFLSPNFRGVLYVKVPKSNRFRDTIAVEDVSIPCPPEAQKVLLDRKYEKSGRNWALNFLLWFVASIGLLEILGIALVWLFLFRAHQNIQDIAQGFRLAETGFRRFTYDELKKATGNFREEIGRGASGVVYKGMLSNEVVVAVKKLYQSEQGEAEFLAEASTIGKLNHRHLIEMWGYCAEGKHRILVYEYMEHGSLSENLSSKKLDWKKRFEIALGIAKGLAYLHEECLEWVLHCDLKPQNILLDSEHKPKVSDFGLSKLVNRGGHDNSSFSRIRGTRGYMAPEWVYRSSITSKVDVYSYGVVLLEMVTGMCPTGISTSEREGVLAENGRLVTWVRDKVCDKSGAIGCDWIEEILDPMIISSDYEMDKVERLVKVALKCVEEDMNVRPSMKQVVEMLRLDASKAEINAGN